MASAGWTIWGIVTVLCGAVHLTTVVSALWPPSELAAGASTSG